MSLKLYMDVNVRSAVTFGLQRRNVDVLRAQDDGAHNISDSDLMDRAAALERVVFTHDHDFLAEAHRRQKAGVPFAGVIYVHMERTTTRRIVDDLELLAKVYETSDMANRVEYLPL